MSHLLNTSLQAVIQECLKTGAFENTPMKFEVPCLMDDPVFSEEGIFEVLRSGCTAYPLFRMYRQGRLLAKEDYTYSRVISDQAIDGLPDMVKIKVLYEAGCTLNLRFIDERVESILDLCNIVAEELQCRSHASCFLTPGKEAGVAPHYDLIDAFMLQLSGTKNWRVWRGSNELPLKQHPYDPEAVKAEIKGIPPDWEFTVSAGDMFYLPRGLIHEVESVGAQPSLHIALDCDPIRYSDIIRSVLEEVLDEFIASETLRRSYPKECMIDKFIARDALEAELPVVAGSVRERVISRISELKEISNSASVYQPTSGFMTISQLIEAQKS